MAMTFTLVSNLREQLATLEKDKVEQHKKDEMEKERLAIEVRISIFLTLYTFNMHGARLRKRGRGVH